MRKMVTRTGICRMNTGCWDPGPAGWKMPQGQVAGPRNGISRMASAAGMVELAFFVTGLGWSGLALLLSNRAGLERAGPGWQLLTKTGLQGFSQA